MGLVVGLSHRRRTQADTLCACAGSYCRSQGAQRQRGQGRGCASRAWLRDGGELVNAMLRRLWCRGRGGARMCTGVVLSQQMPLTRPAGSSARAARGASAASCVEGCSGGVARGVLVTRACEQAVLQVDRSAVGLRGREIAASKSGDLAMIRENTEGGYWTSRISDLRSQISALSAEHGGHNNFKKEKRGAPWEAVLIYLRQSLYTMLRSPASRFFCSRPGGLVITACVRSSLACA